MSPSNICANFIEIDFKNESLINVSSTRNNVDGIIIMNCAKIQEVIELVSSSRFKVIHSLVEKLNLSSENSCFIIKAKVAEFGEIDSSKMMNFIKSVKCSNFLLFFENQKDDIQIFWKFHNEFIFRMEIGIEISNFMLNFLASTIKMNDHCGISKKILSNFDSINSIHEVNLLVLNDFKGRNLLMVATDYGDIDAVKYFINFGFNVNEGVNNEKPIDIAYKKSYYDIVLFLLKANSYFPNLFRINEMTIEIKGFVDMTNMLYDYILQGNGKEIQKILKANRNLRHFYSIHNISAPAYALQIGKIKIYEFLVAHGVYIAPTENLSEILMHIDQSQFSDIQDIHLKYIKNSKEKHLMILTANSFVGHDVPNADEKLMNVRKAFEYLDQIHPFISLILQIVAASRDFKIIFDFNRSSTQYLDPSSGKNSRGIFTFSRHIFIGAADMLRNDGIIEVYGTIAHELCHYAMFLVYKNLCKPYTITNEKNKNEFCKIVTKIRRENGGFEDLVKFVLGYSPDVWHAELIVRVPHMIVKYSNDKEKLDECRKVYPELFRYFEETVYKDLKSELPRIKSRAEEKALKLKKCSKRQSLVLAILAILLPTVVWLAIMINEPIIEQFYSCDNLTDDLRLKMFSSTVDFQGVNVIFGDLFGRNASSCKFLSPNEITSILKIYDSGMFVENHTSVYENFTAIENERILSSVDISYLEKNIGKVSMNHNEEALLNITYMNGNQTVNEMINPDAEKNIYAKYIKNKFRVPGKKVSFKLI